jgi:LysM repeat protein
VPGKKQIFYRTISGDSIWSIARFFKVKDTDLLRWNNLDPEATLATKMVLSLWVDPQVDTSQVVLVDPARVRVVTTGSEEFFELVETLRGRRRIVIKVQAGDTLEKLGKRYGLSVADMERINRMGRQSELEAGQTVIAYQNLSAAERTAAIRKLLAGEALEPDKDEAPVEAFGPPSPAPGPPKPSPPNRQPASEPAASAESDKPPATLPARRLSPASPEFRPSPSQSLAKKSCPRQRLESSLLACDSEPRQAGVALAESGRHIRRQANLQGPTPPWATSLTRKSFTLSEQARRRNAA